jgi:hypothetical protein
MRSAGGLATASRFEAGRAVGRRFAGSWRRSRGQTRWQRCYESSRAGLQSRSHRPRGCWWLLPPPLPFRHAVDLTVAIAPPHHQAMVPARGASGGRPWWVETGTHRYRRCCRPRARSHHTRRCRRRRQSQQKSMRRMSRCSPDRILRLRWKRSSRYATFRWWFESRVAAKPFLTSLPVACPAG